MKNLPIAAKSAINMVLYIVYLFLASVLFSFLFPLVMQILGQSVLHPSDPIFIKIQYFIAILILLVSLVFRKYFYIPLKNEETIEEIQEKKVSYTAKKKATAKKIKTHEKQEDDDIKIYVDKEIK